MITNRGSIITPLILLAVDLQPRLFFYLYSHPLQFFIEPESNNLTLRIRPWNLGIIPWVIFGVGITGILGVGSFIYICFTQYFHLSSVASVPTFNRMILATAAGIACAQFMFTMAPIFFPEVLHGFNQLLVVEHQCM